METNMNPRSGAPFLSVVIPFKNREISRLRSAIASSHESAGDLPLEVVVSDYGSNEIDQVRQLCRETGAVLVETASDTWSRSACLNRGLEIAQGSILMSNDADMLCSPDALKRNALRLLENPSQFVNFQVWDLPEQWTHTALTPGHKDWNAMLNDAQLHSRWGHGLVMFPRSAMRLTGGYDERMHTYGVEDLDFTKRLRSAGYRQQWTGNTSDFLFHVYHPKTSIAAVTDPTVKAIVDTNRSYYLKDPSVIRNLPFRKSNVPEPLVSVVISTQNRASLLRESIMSVLYQTMQDFEIVVVDDGSTDDTRTVVEGFDDKRIRYFYQEPAGIAAARNHGTKVALGDFIAVLDDDDLMVPNRLEVQLNALVPGKHGVVGNFANFNDVTGELEIFGDSDPTINGALPNGGFAGHPTWLFRREVFECVPYNESLSSAVDSNLALRALRSGYRFGHCNSLVTLRRRHSLQVTETDSSNQKIGAQLTKSWLRTAVSPQYLGAAQKKYWSSVHRVSDSAFAISQITPFLPDHLTSRSVAITSSQPLGPWISNRDGASGSEVVVQNHAGEVVSAPVELRDASWEDLVLLRTHGVRHEVRSCQPASNSFEVGPVSNSPTVERTTREVILERADDLVKEQRADLESGEFLVVAVGLEDPNVVCTEVAVEAEFSYFKISSTSNFVELCIWRVKDLDAALQLLGNLSTSAKIYTRDAMVKLSYIAKIAGQAHHVTEKEHHEG